MSAICHSFDRYFSLWHQDLYRLCLSITRNPNDARDLTFESFLRLGAAKDPDIEKDDAKALLFSSAVKLGEDYYLRKMRRAPKKNDSALSGFYRLPLKTRMACALSLAGFSQSDIQQMTHAHRADKPVPSNYMAALSDVCLAEDDVLILSDSIYERFSERSVGVENTLHALHFGFARLAPFLAVLVLALFALAIFVSIKMTA